MFQETTHPLNVCNKLQFSCEIAHYRKNSISVFQEIFASADKVLFFERRTEHEAIIQWSFKIFLIFRNYIRFQAFFFLVWALSPSIGENAVGLSFCKSFIKQGKKNYLQYIQINGSLCSKYKSVKWSIYVLNIS